MKCVRLHSRFEMFAFRWRMIKEHLCRNNLIIHFIARPQVERVNYIQSELNKLEREQEAIDLKANALEKKLRAVMGGAMTSKCADCTCHS